MREKAMVTLFCAHLSAGFFQRPERGEISPAPPAASNLSPFDELRKEMERLFEEMGRFRKPELGGWSRTWAPGCNIYETALHYIILVDLAGVQKEELEVQVNPRQVLLRGEREEPAPVGAELCHQLEIPAGLFERQISLPGGVEPELTKVSYDRGWLEIRLAKPERRKVEIEGEAGG
jgi:HSP20 family protein